MLRHTIPVIAFTLFATSVAYAQSTTADPLPSPIEAEEGVIVVRVAEFASIPDAADGPARPMLLLDEPSTGRMFVNDMRGPLYTVSYDGRSVEAYLDVNDPRWDVPVEASGRERGFQSFALHPDFGREGAPGYGRIYTWTDTRDNRTRADFTPGGGDDTHHTVLLEWRAEDPASSTYDGGPPRVLLRLEQPFGNHNGGHIAFDPLLSAGDPGYGMLYVGVADGGSGGDPLNLSQDLGSPYGKVLRIDPLGSDAENGRYGIPQDNPFVGRAGALGEVWALGVRNPQRFGWDPTTGDVFLADIGQNVVEEVSPVTPGANLGWNAWEGSFRFVSRAGVDTSSPRSDPAMTYPVVEYAHGDPLLLGRRAAVTGVHVYREGPVAQLRGRVLFGDFPSGEIFHFDADDLPDGGNEEIRRVLLDDGGGPRTFLELIQEKNAEQGREPAARTDLRFGTGPDHRFFLLNKHDGTIREVVAGS